MSPKCDTCGGDDFDPIYDCVHHDEHLRAAVLREVREAVDEILRSLWERQRATSMTGTKIYALFEPGGRFAEREKREGK